MAINLKKGQKVDLTKGNSDLKRLLIGLGWGSAKTSSPLSLLMEFLSDFLYSADDIDLDVTAFICANGRLEDKKDIVYYAHLNHYSGAVKHTGDNRTGQGDGDDEQIYVDLSNFPHEKHL